MFDEKKALKVKYFVESQKHSKGEYAGKPFILQDWQYRDIIRPLYGTLNPDGTRQYRTCLIMMAKKNGKTTLASALALYHLFADGEMGGEVYVAATDRDQASLTFDESASMVRKNPSLMKRCKIIDSRKRIVNYRINSFYRAIPADVASAHGVNSSFAVYDELHAAANRKLFDVLSTSMGTRRQPLLIIITTAGYDRHSILYEQYDYAKKILSGVIKDKTFLPVIYETDEKDNWEDEKLWYKANPALGTFRSLEEMRSFADKAKEIPALQNIFRRFYLDQWTQQETRWIPIDKWDSCPNEFDIEDLKGKICYGGLDLSATTDLTAFSLIFPEEGNKTITYFFIPRERMLEKEKKDRVPYSVWEEQGYIDVTEGNAIDYSFIEDKIKKCMEKYQLKEIAYDRWNADYLVQRLMAEGDIEMVPVGMGFTSMNAPTKYLESMILEKKINHNSNPVLKWNFNNIMMKIDAAGNIKPDKGKSTNKIDGIVSLILAIDRIMRHEDDTKSVYDKRGILTV